MHIIDLIKQAIAFIFGQKKHIDELTTTVSDQAARIKDLESQLFASSAAAESIRATVDAATARAKELEDQAAILEASGEELASAISLHPDVPLIVAPDFTSAPIDPPAIPVEPVVPEEITTAPDKVDALKEAQKDAEASAPPVEVDFAALDVVTTGNDPVAAAGDTPSVDAPSSEEAAPADPSTATEESTTAEP